MKSHRNFSQLTHPIPLIGILTHVLVRFVVFGCILDCLLLHETRCKTGWTGAINAKVRATNSHPTFFATNPPDPPHWTLNSCIGAFRSVSVHLAMFCYYTELGAKWVELVQLMKKFVPRNRIGIFGSERTRSTHWTVNSCFGAFWSVWVHFGFFR